MAYIQWPSTLPQLVNTDGYTYALGDTTIRSEVDVGPSKVRQRTTRAIDKMGFTLDLTFAQYTYLKTFFKTTTAGGTERFMFTDPFSREQVIVRFTRPPSISPLGGDYLRASIEVEVMP